MGLQFRAVDDIGECYLTPPTASVLFILPGQSEWAGPIQSEDADTPARTVGYPAVLGPILEDLRTIGVFGSAADLGTLALWWSSTFETPVGAPGAGPIQALSELRGQWLMDRLKGAITENGDSILHDGVQLPFGPIGDDTSVGRIVLPVVVIEGLEGALDCALPGGLPYFVACGSAEPEFAALAIAKALGKLAGLAEESPDPENLAAPDTLGRAAPNTAFGFSSDPWPHLRDLDPEGEGSAPAAGALGRTDSGLLRYSEECVMGRPLGEGPPKFCRPCHQHLSHLFLDEDVVELESVAPQLALGFEVDSQGVVGPLSVTPWQDADAQAIWSTVDAVPEGATVVVTAETPTPPPVDVDGDEESNPEPPLAQSIRFDHPTGAQLDLGLLAHLGPSGRTYEIRISASAAELPEGTPEEEAESEIIGIRIRGAAGFSSDAPPLRGLPEGGLQAYGDSIRAVTTPAVVSTVPAHRVVLLSSNWWLAPPESEDAATMGVGIGPYASDRLVAVFEEDHARSDTLAADRVEGLVGPAIRHMLARELRFADDAEDEYRRILAESTSVGAAPMSPARGRRDLWALTVEGADLQLEATLVSGQTAALSLYWSSPGVPVQLERLASGLLGQPSQAAIGLGLTPTASTRAASPQEVLDDALALVQDLLIQPSSDAFVLRQCLKHLHTTRTVLGDLGAEAMGTALRICAHWAIRSQVEALVQAYPGDLLEDFRRVSVHTPGSVRFRAHLRAYLRPALDLDTILRTRMSSTGQLGGLAVEFIERALLDAPDHAILPLSNEGAPDQLLATLDEVATIDLWRDDRRFWSAINAFAERLEEDLDAGDAAHRLRLLAMNSHLRAQLITRAHWVYQASPERRSDLMAVYRTAYDETTDPEDRSEAAETKRYFLHAFADRLWYAAPADSERIVLEFFVRRWVNNPPADSGAAPTQAVSAADFEYLLPPFELFGDSFAAASTRLESGTVPPEELEGAQARFQRLAEVRQGLLEQLGDPPQFLPRQQKEWSRLRVALREEAPLPDDPVMDGLERHLNGISDPDTFLAAFQDLRVETQERLLTWGGQLAPPSPLGTEVLEAEHILKTIGVPASPQEEATALEQRSILVAYRLLRAATASSGLFTSSRAADRPIATFVHALARLPPATRLSLDSLTNFTEARRQLMEKAVGFTPLGARLSILDNLHTQQGAAFRDAVFRLATANSAGGDTHISLPYTYAEVIQLDVPDEAAQFQMRLAAASELGAADATALPEEWRATWRDHWQLMEDSVTQGFLEEPDLEAMRDSLYGLPDVRDEANLGIELEYLRTRLRLRQGERTGHNWLADHFTVAGAELDETLAELEVLLRRISDGTPAADDPDVVRAFLLTTTLADQTARWATGRSAFADYAGSAAAIAIGTTVMVTSGGTASPAVIAAAAGMSGSASVALRNVIEGPRYVTSGENVITFSRAAIEAALDIGVGTLLRTSLSGRGVVARFANGLETAVTARTGSTALGAAAKEVLLDTLEGAIAGAAGAVFETAVDEATYAQSWYRILLSFLESAVKGSLFGGVIGGTTSAVTSLVGAGVSAVLARRMTKWADDAGHLDEFLELTPVQGARAYSEVLQGARIEALEMIFHPDPVPDWLQEIVASPFHRRQARLRQAVKQVDEALALFDEDGTDPLARAVVVEWDPDGHVPLGPDDRAALEIITDPTSADIDIVIHLRADADEDVLLEELVHVLQILHGSEEVREAALRLSNHQLRNWGTWGTEGVDGQVKRLQRWQDRQVLENDLHSRMETQWDDGRPLTPEQEDALADASTSLEEGVAEQSEIEKLLERARAREDVGAEMQRLGLDHRPYLNGRKRKRPKDHFETALASGALAGTGTTLATIDTASATLRANLGGGWTQVRSWGMWARSLAGVDERFVHVGAGVRFTKADLIQNGSADEWASMSDLNGWPSVRSRVQSSLDRAADDGLIPAEDIALVLEHLDDAPVGFVLGTSALRSAFPYRRLWRQLPGFSLGADEDLHHALPLYLMALEQLSVRVRDVDTGEYRSVPGVALLPLLKEPDHVDMHAAINGLTTKKDGIGLAPSTIRSRFGSRLRPLVALVRRRRPDVPIGEDDVAGTQQFWWLEDNARFSPIAGEELSQ